MCDIKDRWPLEKPLGPLNADQGLGYVSQKRLSDSTSIPYR